MPSELLSDEQLVRRCRTELPYVSTAFEALVRRYEVLVFRTCFQYLNNEQEAEEVTQDVFMRVFHGVSRFEQRSSFRTWLFRIAINQCASRYARLQELAHRQEAIAVETDQAADDREGRGSENPADWEGPTSEALQALSEDDRRVLLLRHVADLSLDEIAVALATKLSAAKMRLYRAEERFRQAYSRIAAPEDPAVALRATAPTILSDHGIRSYQTGARPGGV